MTDLPQWAMEKAREVYNDLGYHHEHQKDVAACIRSIARALVEAEARGIERAAKVVYQMPSFVALSDEEVERCGMFVRETGKKKLVAAISKLMEPTNEQ